MVFLRPRVELDPKGMSVVSNGLGLHWGKQGKIKHRNAIWETVKTRAAFGILQ